jgi:hypothetical protein
MLKMKTTVPATTTAAITAPATRADIGNPNWSSSGGNWFLGAFHYNQTGYNVH